MREFRLDLKPVAQDDSCQEMGVQEFEAKHWGSSVLAFHHSPANAQYSFSYLSWEIRTGTRERSLPEASGVPENIPYLVKLDYLVGCMPNSFLLVTFYTRFYSSPL